MVSTLFHNNLAAELAAEREKNKELTELLEKITKQRDLIKHKWEVLYEESENLKELNKQLLSHADSNR